MQVAKLVIYKLVAQEKKAQNLLEARAKNRTFQIEGGGSRVVDIGVAGCGRFFDVRYALITVILAHLQSLLASFIEMCNQS